MKERDINRALVATVHRGVVCKRAQITDHPGAVPMLRDASRVQRRSPAREQLRLDPMTEGARKVPGFHAPTRLALACIVAACADRPEGQRAQLGSLSDDPDVAELILELEIGGEDSKDVNYEFASIGSILIASDKTVWVKDGSEGMGQTPAILLYNDEGKFLRRVGRAGDGPGEYRAPTGMAQLTDDRVVVRDQFLSNRLTLYAADGAFTTTWSLGAGYYYFGRDAVRVDTAGFVWLPVTGRPGRNRPVPFYLRLRPDGSIADTIPYPSVPEDNRDRMQFVRTFPSGNKQNEGHRVPYWPHAKWAWSPYGSYAISNADRYLIEIRPFPGVPTSGNDGATIAEPRKIERSVRPVEVPAAERAAFRASLMERLSRPEINYDGEILEVPAQKPPIRGLQYTDDGLLLVSVSLPSRRQDGAWSESTGYDVFDRDHHFMGRLILPDGFTLRVFVGDRLWGVVLGEFGVPWIRRYRIVWPRRG